MMGGGMVLGEKRDRVHTHTQMMEVQQMKPMAKSPKPQGATERLHFLDNLKTFIIFLVVFFHSAYAYARYLSKDWYVVDTQQSVFFDIFIMVVFAFIMPVMFFVAGYMGIASLARKSQVDFWRDKLRRIIAPWAAGALIVAPAIAYAAHASRGDYPSYLSYWAHYFFSQDYQIRGQVHFYFLCVLALYYVVLWAAYRIYPSLSARSARRPSTLFLILFGLATGILCYVGLLFVDEGRWVKIAIFDVPGAKFIPFMCYFFLGVLAYRRKWFTPSGYDPRLWPWLLMSFVCFVIFGALLNPQLRTGPIGMMAYSLFQFLFCLAAVFTLFAIFQKHLNYTNRLLTNLSASSYGTYFIHYLVIVVVILGLRGFHMNVFLKWLIGGAVSALVSYLISRYLLALTPLFGRTAGRPGTSRSADGSLGVVSPVS
jgi:glucan biosynthesis protein C